MEDLNRTLLAQSESVKRDLAALKNTRNHSFRLLQQLNHEKVRLEQRIAANTNTVRRMYEALQAKQHEAAAALAAVNTPLRGETEPRFGAEARLDQRILRFKELEATLPPEQRRQIRGMLRDKVKVRDVRLANMLAYHWGFDKICMILIDGQDIYKRLSEWERQTQTYIDLLDVSDFESRLRTVTAALTAPLSSDDASDDPAFVKFLHSPGTLTTHIPHDTPHALHETNGFFVNAHVQVGSSHRPTVTSFRR